MNRNYPESFNTFWDKILSGKKVSKTIGARDIKASIKNGEVNLEMCGELYDNYSIYSKEDFYCTMLELHMFPRVKEFE